MIITERIVLLKTPPKYRNNSNKIKRTSTIFVERGIIAHIR